MGLKLSTGLVTVLGQIKIGNGIVPIVPIVPITTALLVQTIDNPNNFGSSANDFFSTAMAATDDYIAIGAYSEDDATGNGSGSVYVYNGAGTSLLHTIVNPNPFGTGISDNFGDAVALEGTTLVIGARLEDTASFSNQGMVYVYNAATGAPLHTLESPSPAANSYFGIDVAIVGSYILVGENGYPSEVHVYDSTTGVFQHTITNPNPFGTPTGDAFGASIAVHGTKLFVSAPGEDDAGGTQSGKAYVYDIATSTLLHTLDDPNAFGTTISDRFGTGKAVDISSDYMIVGAAAEDVNGNGSGVAYIYDVDTGSLLHTLLEPGGAPGYAFGAKVHIQGNYAAVSAPYSGGSIGKIYLFDAVTGSLITTITNPNPFSDAFDNFGYEITMTDSKLIVGSLEDDAGGTVSGKAYVYDLS